MTSHFDNELAGLREKLLTMASHAETTVRNAVDALLQRDPSMVARVKADDEILDRLELEIDEMAVQLLAKAPLATSLRLIFVCTKVSQNLERVGDEATKIAKRADELCAVPPLKQVSEVPPFAESVLKMLRSSIDAFVSNDAALARKLIPQDKELDAWNRRIHQAVTAEIRSFPEHLEPGLHLMVVSKSLERIADHAKNIAEEVVYLCEAQDIRHERARTGGGA